MSTVPAPCRSQELSGHETLGREILRELIETNTTPSSGDNTRAAQIVAERFRTAGFPPEDVHVLAPAPRKGNLIVRLRGGVSRPILWLAHLDVVEANKEDWSVDPFRFLEQDGYFYGRGAYDNKAGAAILVTTFLRLKQEGFKPNRDLILALTALGGEVLRNIHYLPPSVGQAMRNLTSTPSDSFEVFHDNASHI